MLKKTKANFGRERRDFYKSSVVSNNNVFSNDKKDSFGN
jgi:hypothetical protein